MVSDVSHLIDSLYDTTLRNSGYTILIFFDNCYYKTIGHSDMSHVQECIDLKEPFSDRGKTEVTGRPSTEA